MDDKLARISLQELEAHARALKERGHRAEADELLVYQHLISALRANSERDLQMARLARRFDTLETTVTNDRDRASLAYRALLGEFRELQRRQAAADLARDADRARLDILAAVVDANVTKILDVARRAEALALDVGDRD